ncbi:MAG: class I SAM-dependent methyltransferase [Waddliaceae bacterium]
MKVDEAYEISSKDYDAHRERSPYFKIIEGLTRRCFHENTQGKTYDLGLDVGCGTGRNLPMFLEKCHCVRGVDYTPGMLKYAMGSVADNPKVDLMIGDVRSLPFVDDTFDLVGCFKALPHVSNVESALRELVRVTRKGGTVFTEFCSPYSFRWLLNRMKHHTDWHTVDHATKLLTQAGLKVKKVYGLRTFMVTEYLCYLPGGHHLFNYLENRFTNTFFNRFSGYYIVVCEK